LWAVRSARFDDDVIAFRPQFTEDTAGIVARNIPVLISARFINAHESDVHVSAPARSSAQPDQRRRLDGIFAENATGR